MTWDEVVAFVAPFLVFGMWLFGYAVKHAFDLQKGRTADSPAKQQHLELNYERIAALERECSIPLVRIIAEAEEVARDEADPEAAAWKRRVGARLLLSSDDLR